MGFLALLVALIVPCAGEAHATATVDIGLSATVAPNPATDGSNVTYTLDAFNDGPFSATRMHVNNQFPGTFVSASVTVGRCFPPTGNYVDCDIGSLPPGGHATVTLTVTPAGVGQTTFIAFVQSAETDVNSANQRVIVSGTVVPSGPNPPLNVSVGIGEWGSNAPFQTSRSFLVTWSAIDPQADLDDISAYDVRIRTAAAGSAISQYSVMRRSGLTWGVRWSGTPGTTYCFSVRAYSAAGFSSDWTLETCTAVPYSAAKFHLAAGCRITSSSTGYLGKLATCRGGSQGVRMSPLRGRRFAVIVERCPGCGIAVVHVGGKEVARANLAGPPSLVVIPVALFDPRRTVAIAVRPSGRLPIEVAGVGVSAA